VIIETSMFIERSFSLSISSFYDIGLSAIAKLDISGRKYLKGDNRFNDFGLVFSLNAFLESGVENGETEIGLSARCM